MLDNTELTIEELLNAAVQCEQYEEFDVALKYYRQVLKVDPRQSAAKMGEERNKNQLAKNIYFRSEANFRLVTGRLELRRGMLVFVASGGNETEYELERIENPKIQLGRLKFDYDGRTIEGYSCSVAKKWVNILTEAKEGCYPANENGTLNSVERYIRDNYTMDRIDDAAEYFAGLSGCTYSDARVVVRRVLS